MDKIEVTQADREEAAAILRLHGEKHSYLNELLAGNHDSDGVVIILARHRLSHTPQSVEPVAWMPIESAPKDGTEILCRGSFYGKPCHFVAIWNGAQWYAGWGDSIQPDEWQPIYPHPPATHVAALVDENERLRQALEDVANPMSMIQRQAEAEGSQLSGMAYSIANDLGFVQTIARRALAPFTKGQP